ncbi:MAG: type III secretion system chaperone [Puniceicoccales bacterium]|jgi:poly(3-hydroxyalkanoate) synthetase|nr:type III secretion system chaperone [Puniceicoccales bacterium]
MDLELLLKTYSQDVLKHDQALLYDSTYGSVLDLNDGEIKCHIEPAEAQIYFYAPIFEIPAKSREKLFKSLLTNQLFGKLTGQSYFGLDEKNNHVILFRVLEGENITQNAFNGYLNSFIEACLLWKAALRETHSS